MLDGAAPAVGRAAVPMMPRVGSEVGLGWAATMPAGAAPRAGRGAAATMPGGVAAAVVRGAAATTLDGATLGVGRGAAATMPGVGWRVAANMLDGAALLCVPYKTSCRRTPVFLHFPLWTPSRPGVGRRAAVTMTDGATQEVG